MSAVAEVLDGEDREKAHRWAKRLLRLEVERTGLTAVEAMPRVARHVGILPGTLENVTRKRIKEPRPRLMDRLRAAMIRELQAEMRRYEHEIQLLLATGADPRDDEIAEVEAGLARIREVLGGR